MTRTKRLQAHINTHTRQGDLLNEREERGDVEILFTDIIVNIKATPPP